MSFWLHESKSMFVLRSIPSWLRWCFLLCLVVGISAIWYVWWYKPLQQVCNKATITIEELSKKNYFLYKIIKQNPALAIQKEELDQKLQKLVDGSRSDDCAMIDLLLGELKQHSILCKELKPLKIEMGEFWQKHFFDIVFKGSFKNIKTFMHDFFTQQRFVSCNKLSLVRWKDHEIKGELSVMFITFGEHEEKI